MSGVKPKPNQSLVNQTTQPISNHSKTKTNNKLSDYFRQETLAIETPLKTTLSMHTIGLLYICFSCSYMRSEYSNIWETHQCRPHAYGHTWSAGYELASGMLHGHAVATGMGFGAYLSFCNGWITQHELSRILKLLSDLELSLWHPIMQETATLYRVQESVIEKRAGNLVAPVPKGLGKCGYINEMPYELLDKRLREYREICQRYPRQGVGIEVHCKDIGLEDPATVGNVNKNLPKDDVQDSAFKNCLQYCEKSVTDNGAPR